MRVLIATDAWAPQVNGVVRTLEATAVELRRKGHEVTLLNPQLFRSWPCPSYPEIRLALARRDSIGAHIAAARPQAIHIATEGPIGLATRRWCLKRGKPFTTAYHTQFPDYLAKRTKLPAEWFWRYIRWFHRPAHGVMVSTPTMASELNRRGLAQTRLWGRGVDLSAFRPDAPPHPALADCPRPVQLYVGRVAVEKNIEAFLKSNVSGAKIVVGDGPALAGLKRDYPEVKFLGALRGEALAGAYAAADVFVFPSRTDTFGLVMIEAMASGTPVAAYPVLGPRDVVTPEVGCLDEDLDTAIREALTCDRAVCAAYGRSFSWEASACQFEASLLRFEDEAA